MKGFADRVREARVAAGMTQEQLGFAIGVTKSSVSAWETGRDTPGFRTLPSLRTALKRSLDELVCGIAAIEHADVGTETADAVEDSGTSARDERERTLLLRYRSLSARRKNALLELIRATDDDRAAYE